MLTLNALENEPFDTNLRRLESKAWIAALNCVCQWTVDSIHSSKDFSRPKISREKFRDINLNLLFWISEKGKK